MQKQLGNPVQYIGKRFTSNSQEYFSFDFPTRCVQFTTFAKHAMHRGVFSSLPHLELQI